MTTRRETNAAIDETTTRLPATVDRAARPAGAKAMANPAAAPPGRVAVLGAAAASRLPTSRYHQASAALRTVTGR